MSEEQNETMTGSETTDAGNDADADKNMVVEEILVEGVSIDGMCGVY